MIRGFIGASLRATRLAGLALLGATLFGCATARLPAPTPSVDVVQSLRAANAQPARTGVFALAAGKDAGMDRSQGGLRGSSVQAENGSFSQYLKDEVATELKAAGLYDENAKTVIDAQLLDSQLDAAIGTGTGRLAAHFSVTRDERKLYDKDVAVEDRWDSSFIGAVAVPAAINHYGQFYRQLVAKLFDDPDFRAAIAK